LKYPDKKETKFICDVSITMYDIQYMEYGYINNNNNNNIYDQ